MTLETRRIDIDGLVFDVDVAGPAGAPLVLLLHGYPQSKFAWRHELPALAAAGYRAAAPNQRGYSPGARPAEVRDYAIKHLVGDILQFADKLDADRFHLVGHDWGGALAWVAASWYPERLRSLTVLSRPHPDAFGRAMRDDPDQAQRSRHHKAFQDPATERLLLEDGARRLRESLARNRVPSEAIEAYLETRGAKRHWGRRSTGIGPRPGTWPRPTGRRSRWGRSLCPHFIYGARKTPRSGRWRRAGRRTTSRGPTPSTKSPVSAISSPTSVPPPRRHFC